MGTKTIMYDRVVPPGGEFRPRTRVRVRLVAADSGEGTGYNSSDRRTIIGVADELLDVELFVVDLDAQTSISAPAVTAYEITRVYPGWPAPPAETFTAPAEPTPTATTQEVTLPAANIAASTSGFASSGAIYLDGQLVTYTGTTPTAFTGCTGGTGLVGSGSAVRQAHWIPDFLVNPPVGLPNLHVDDAIGAHAASAVAVAPTGGLVATDAQAALAELDSELAAEAALARNADNLTSGTVADARIAASIARDSEVTAAVAAEAALRETGDTTRAANQQVANYTLVLSDAGKAVEGNAAGALSFTIPPNASAAFPTGTIIEVVQVGAGAVTLVPGSGVTITGDTVTPAQGGSLLLRKTASNAWFSAITSVRSGTFVATTGAVTKTGPLTLSRPADSEGAYFARLGGPALAPGGGRGLDLIRESNGSVAINFGCDIRPTDWVIGLDLEETAADGTGNSHLVLAYDAVKQADLLRLASGAKLEFANSVAYPDLTARLTLASYMGLPGGRDDAAPLTDMLKINVAATSPVSHFLRCLAPSEKFVVLRTGHIGINLNGSSPSAPLHCVAAGDAVKMDRGGSADTAWAAWTQGSGTGDWRAGLEANTTNFVLYAANGASPTPSAPGTLRLRITQAGVATFNASELALAPPAGGSKTISFGVSAGYLRVVGGITNLAATGGYIELTNGVKAIGQTTAQAVFLIQPPPAQTADLLRLTASNGTTVIGRFDKLGRLGIRTVAVPLDADVATSEMIVWLKDTVGSAGLQLRSKDSAGTIVAQDFSKGSAVTAPAGGATVDAESRTAIGQIIAHLQRMGVAA